MVSSSGVTLTQLNTRELEAVEASPAFRAVNARIHERFDALVGRPQVAPGTRGLSWGIHPFTGRRVRMMTTAAR